MYIEEFNLHSSTSYLHISFLRHRANRPTQIGDIQTDGDELPNGEWMTKQCFWLNASYVSQVVKELLSESIPAKHSDISYEIHEVGVMQVAHPNAKYEKPSESEET